MTAFDPLAERATEALERIADLLERLLAEPEPGDERTGEDEPEPPIDAAPEWQPVKGGRAWLPFARIDAPGVEGESVVVDQLYESEGDLVAVVVTEDAFMWRVFAASLEAPR